MLTYRPGTPQDAYPAYRVFRLAIQVVYYQHRIIETLEPFDEAAIRSGWENWPGSRSKSSIRSSIRCGPSA